MTSTSLVPVEGLIARPRIAPLDGVPPFGCEWVFRGTSGARSGHDRLAALKTSCIDVEAPHRTCNWQPLVSASSEPLADAVPIAPFAANLAVPHASGAARRSDGRRAMAAICWSIGALGIIGWLVAAHELRPGSMPTAVAPGLAGAMQIGAIQRQPPLVSPAAVRSAEPIVEAIDSPSVLPGVARRPEVQRRVTVSDVQRVADATLEPTRIRRTNVRQLTGSVATVARPAAGRHAASIRNHHRPGALPPVADTRDPLDDPLTLIAMANALRASQPTSARPSPTAGYDWTAQLSQRRLTDTPDVFAH
ncbi:hypothetical protein DM39_5846 [Burkholderia cenocepacia]|uniref:Uncharacterized protein n=1 Tax=Burkholderia cenocepacia TaxID=95486 RepID=A0AAN0VQT0_9BURK|nr:hypothetical protein DM39_5846 [Burkholderia cenocepacia]